MNWLNPPSLAICHLDIPARQKPHRMHRLHVCLQDWRGMLQGEPGAKWWENPHEVVGNSFFLEFLHVVFNNVQSSCLFLLFSTYLILSTSSAFPLYAFLIFDTWLQIKMMECRWANIGSLLSNANQQWNRSLFSGGQLSQVIQFMASSLRSSLSGWWF